MLVDANVLICAIDRESQHHERAAAWLVETINTGQRWALPWQTVGTFLRLTSDRRITTGTVSAARSWGFVEEWLELPNCFMPEPGPRSRTLLGQWLADGLVSGSLVPEAQLAALALEHGLPVASADSGFARFPGLTWIDPVHP